MARAVPITVRCECGEAVAADLGDTVSCVCGRRYDTSKVEPTEFGTVRVAQARVRLYVQIGLIFIATVTVLAAVAWGLKGAAVGGPVAALLWFRLLGRWYKRRWLKELGDRPSLSLEAE